MGYGKFEYTREGVNHARGSYPVNFAGCAITFLNSPSDSEIYLSPSPQVLLMTSYLTLAEGVMKYGEYPLYALAVGVLSADDVRIVASSILEHSIADPCDVAGNSMACVVFGHSLREENIIIRADRIVTLQDSKGSCLVDRLQHSTVSGFPTAVTSSATQFLVFDQPTITEVLSARWKSPCIHHTGHNLHRSNRADAVNLSLPADEFVVLGQIMKTALILLFVPPIQFDILPENHVDKRSALAFVSVTQSERRLLIEKANTRTNNIVVGARQKSQLIQGTVAVIDLFEKSGAEQFAQFPCIDFIRLRTVKKKPVLERITDQDPVCMIEEFQVQPMRRPRFLEGDDRATPQ